MKVCTVLATKSYCLVWNHLEMIDLYEQNVLTRFAIRTNRGRLDSDTEWTLSLTVADSSVGCNLSIFQQVYVSYNIA